MKTLYDTKPENLRFLHTAFHFLHSAVWRRHSRGILLILLTAILLSSCRNNQNLMYLKNLDISENDKVFLKQSEIYRIKPHDILYVKILSTNREISELYNNNPTRGVTTTMSSEADQYVNGFSVSKEGHIVLPVLGKLSVAGISLLEAYELIQDQANEYLIDATVVVRLLNYKVTVLGEVNRPGVYFNYNNQLTALEAIGRAGDVTEFGDKEQILVIRPTDDGTKTFEINLTDKSVLTQPGFYLMPNDVLYVKPASNKAFRVNLPVWNLLLSSLTTLIVLVQYFDNK
jgi:polysaccharide export outer membrane protein